MKKIPLFIKFECAIKNLEKMNLYKVIIRKKNTLCRPPRPPRSPFTTYKYLVAAKTFREVCEKYPNAKKIKDMGTLEMITPHSATVR